MIKFFCNEVNVKRNPCLCLFMYPLCNSEKKSNQIFRFCIIINNVILDFSVTVEKTWNVLKNMELHISIDIRSLPVIAFARTTIIVYCFSVERVFYFNTSFSQLDRFLFYLTVYHIRRNVRRTFK